MYPYIPCTSDDEREMLKNTGMEKIDDLFSDIPDEIKLKRPLNLGKPMPEIQVLNKLKSISEKNKSADDAACFLGAGSYDHFIPSAVKNMLSRSEFYSAYTPYQAEISQGTLQTIFEFQTMISNLTGMDAANASMYDGATACAEAAIMAISAKKKKKILASKTLHPEIRKVLRTYMRFHGGELEEIDSDEGATDVKKLKNMIDSSTAAVIVQNPNFFGIIEDYTEVEKIAHENGAFLILDAEPISLGILKTPGEIGADIAVGEAQPLGNNMNFGGPNVGYMASSSKLFRKMPGRIVGQTKDVDGKRAFVLTLQAREQHIRRQKATSNICSNEALSALAAAMYMTFMGKQGIREVALQCLNKSHYAFRELTKTGKFKPLYNRPFFNEFAVKSNLNYELINKELLRNNIIGGYCLDRDYPLQNSILLCVTEKRTKEEIDELIDIMEGLK